MQLDRDAAPSAKRSLTRGLSMGGIAMSLPSTINPTGAVFGPTLGISRNMEWDIGPDGATLPGAAPLASGGGNLNGSANTANLLGQAGTSGRKIAVPRQSTGNYTGIV